MIRVAIIITRIDNLGPVKVISNLVNSLIGQNEIRVSVFYIDKEVNDQIKMNIPVQRLKLRDFRFNDFDIVHTSGIRPDLFAFLHRKKIKYHISTLHNFVFEDLSYTYNKFISWFFGNIWLILLIRSDRMVCVSVALKDYYSRWFKSDKLVVIHNGISESDISFNPDQAIINVIGKFHSEGLTVLGFAGILTRRKGVDQILSLLSQKKELAFVIIGDGKEHKALISEARKLDVLDRCLFCGFKENAVGYFNYFDLFVMPSRSEGFGLALIEGVQQNIPVICSDIAVFNELFSTEEVTFFKPDNLSSLINAVTTAKETGKVKSVLAHYRYLGNYKSVLMAKKYYELYRSA
jgi:glycosyltransferase involved in cell wall biosynthesis